MIRSLKFILAVCISSAASLSAQEPAPTWGRAGVIVPEATNPVFATADGCAGCHSAAEGATALRDDTGADVSPYALWRGTMMANSFRDPYWRAQVAREIAFEPGKAADIQKLCITCHAPTAHHGTTLLDEPFRDVRTLASDALARDGVTCTVCHQAQPEGLGEAESFNGGLTIGLEREIFGPYEEPFFQPMQMHSAFRARHGSHVRDAALCGSCHTLFTQPSAEAEPFPEQTPYLEWRNSAFENEITADGDSRSCQECHMPEIGEVTLARSPRGGAFTIDPRPNFRGHAFVGGNALMLEILRDNRARLGVTARAEDLQRMIHATRRQLSQKTAKVEIESLQRDRSAVSFDVVVTNLTGHKFPTGYPARRAWLRVTARVGRTIVFSSGAIDGIGRLAGIDDEFAIPHRDVVTDGAQPVVYEAVPLDLSGHHTTLVHTMAQWRKDNRLLPRGWRRDGPHASVTAPIGLGDDENFAGGSDRVTYSFPIDASLEGAFRVNVELLYQSIPPHWVEPLRTVEAEEAELFVEVYDAATTVAEIIARAVARE